MRLCSSHVYLRSQQRPSHSQTPNRQRHIFIELMVHVTGCSKHALPAAVLAYKLDRRHDAAAQCCTESCRNSRTMSTVGLGAGGRGRTERYRKTGRAGSTWWRAGSAPRWPPRHSPPRLRPPARSCHRPRSSRVCRGAPLHRPAVATSAAAALQCTSLRRQRLGSLSCAAVRNERGAGCGVSGRYRLCCGRAPGSGSAGQNGAVCGMHVDGCSGW